jgi:two-component system chemotaxis response regulator CheY
MLQSISPSIFVCRGDSFTDHEMGWVISTMRNENPRGGERRKQKRVVLKREVTINNSLKVMGLDLSEGGVYVHTGRSITRGKVVDVSLPLNNGTVNLKARVQHSEEGVGMGLMFLDRTSDALALLREFIDSTSIPLTEAVKKKVLIVDDNVMHRLMNRSRLVLEGFTVLEAGNGLEAVEIMKKEQIKLVVLDLYMDQLDGFQVLSIMKKNPEWKDIPVLVLSARSAPAEVDKAVAAGATEFLVKMTTTPVKLSERVKQHLLSK